jgi:prepilin-type N-terminal cleavage/methylation domain-containing protein/prepilin-type processing-associated H-X9-DG protein
MTVGYVGQTGIRAVRGFTLIELLVVISIIALLIGILLPVLGTVRGEGRRLLCATQLQQMGVGLHNFAAQHRDALPAAYTSDGGAISWDDAISEYVGRPLTQTEAAAGNLPAERGAAVFTCPADPVVELISEAVRSYAMVRANTDVAGVSRGVGLVDSSGDAEGLGFVLGSGELPAPSDTLLLSEFSASGFFYNRQGGELRAYLDRALQQKPSSFNSNLLHGSESKYVCNYLFVDGHVAVYEPIDTIGDGQVLGTSEPNGFWTRASGD